MPRPKRSVKKIFAYLTEKAWKNIEGKGEISKLVNEALEKINDQQTQIVINLCKRYDGVHPKNTALIYCRDPEGKGKRCMPKIECQACKYLKDNEVVLKSISELENEYKTKKENVEKLEKDISRLQSIKGAYLGDITKIKAEIEKLKEEYQSVNVPDLEAKLKSTLEVVREKNEQIATLQTDNEHLNEQIQHTKIEPKIIEKPIIQYREVTKEKIVIKDRILIPCSYRPKGFSDIMEECPPCAVKCSHYHQTYEAIKSQST